jgi:transcription antitermination factor NusG
MDVHVKHDQQLHLNELAAAVYFNRVVSAEGFKGENPKAFRGTSEAPLGLLWKKTPPSEDGEALLKNCRTTSPALSLNLARHWFAVYTTCRHEKRVARNLEQRQIEHFLPTYRTQHTWKDGTRAILDLPLFPGYVFVRIDLHDRVGVLEVPGVVSMIGTARQPAPLPELEVDALRAGLDPTKVEPHPLLTVGQRVRIARGALAGVEGIVVRKKSGLQVVLTLSLLMQSIAIEVSGGDVELTGT